MFTGLVQFRSTVVARNGSRLTVSAPKGVEDWVIGESIAVNGVCLTLVGLLAGLEFDVSGETDSRTTLGQIVPGHPVNIERAMRPVDRFGGHIVQGHVDRIGSVVAITRREGSWDFEFECGADGDRYLVDKGSVAVDGVSLTVIQPENGRFRVAVIPHTFAETTLGLLQPGEPVNIEFDALAKHVEKLISAWAR